MSWLQSMTTLFVHNLSISFWLMSCFKFLDFVLAVSSSIVSSKKSTSTRRWQLNSSSRFCRPWITAMEKISSIVTWSQRTSFLFPRTPILSSRSSILASPRCLRVDVYSEWTLEQVLLTISLLRCSLAATIALAICGRLAACSTFCYAGTHLSLAMTTTRSCSPCQRASSTLMVRSGTTSTIRRRTSSANWFARLQIDSLQHKLYSTHGWSRTLQASMQLQQINSDVLTSATSRNSTTVRESSKLPWWLSRCNRTQTISRSLRKCSRR